MGLARFLDKKQQPESCNNGGVTRYIRSCRKTALFAAPQEGQSRKPNELEKERCEVKVKKPFYFF